MISISKIEFDLTIKKYGVKEEPYGYRDRDEKPKFEIQEELKFKTLNAVEVIRKILDYLV